MEKVGQPSIAQCSRPRPNAIAKLTHQPENATVLGRMSVRERGTAHAETLAKLAHDVPQQTDVTDQGQSIGGAE